MCKRYVKLKVEKCLKSEIKQPFRRSISRSGKVLRRMDFKNERLFHIWMLSTSLHLNFSLERPLKLQAMNSRAYRRIFPVNKLSLHSKYTGYPPHSYSYAHYMHIANTLKRPNVNPGLFLRAILSVEKIDSAIIGLKVGKSVILW